MSFIIFLVIALLSGLIGPLVGQFSNLSVMFLLISLNVLLFLFLLAH